MGLIGGSMAKAIKLKTKNKVFGYDISVSEMKKALLLEAVDEELTDEGLSSCDIVILAIYPQDTINYIADHAHLIKKDAIVMDCCGVKRDVCASIWPLAKEYGFTFVGGHPMAGIEYSGFNHARENLFLNASMIFVPPADVRIQVMETLKKLCLEIGFGNIVMTTAETHDKIIACTSQLAHVVSSAYVKSPTATEYKGFTAGSFRDMTRVAKLNEKMWTELFIENKDNLISEIDSLIERLQEYSSVLKTDDEEKLLKLLKEGRERKILLEKKYNEWD